MRTKIILTIFILTLIVIFFLKNNPLFVSKIINTELVKTNNKKKLIKKPTAIKKKSNEIKKIQSNKTTDTTEITIIDTVYDSDPVVDANMILHNYKLCYEQIDDSLNSSNYTKLFKQRFNDKQIKQYQNLKNHCIEINKKFPEYSLSDKKALSLQRSKADATSLWGQIINGEINASDLDDATIQGLLKQNNLTILIDAQNRLKEYYLKVIHWDLEDVLANHQYDYVSKIRHYAHQQYLCSIGASCDQLSTIMMNLCYLNSKSCGLDYPHFITNVLTQGQQADIGLAFKYLQSQYK